MRAASEKGRLAMRRKWALVLLGLGAVLGFASGFHDLRHGAHPRGHFGPPCYVDGRPWLFGF
jgi:hypothetical protein